ncbi:hypothetical protein VaNZ11_006238 [Volvox africanus]|uniref:Polymerase nucleotidyl transferase domain-containing protein n=1 Tax=Volvox africanus TaxID=51714 RepID=A0ABQ5S1W2_9CHLO|nr:hypothetical protein VaNZ11_006238 [Volvox africanus]
MKPIDGDAGGMGRRCTCPCVCGARKFNDKQPFSLPPELAKALDLPLTNVVGEYSMPDWKKDMYSELRDCIQEAVDYAFVEWKMPDEAKVLLDGSALKGTALDDSDMDLVVRTTYRVPRSVKLKAHQVIKAKLVEKYGSGNVSFTQKRKSAEFVVEAHRRTAAAATIDASDVDDVDDDQSVQDELRVEWKAPAPAADWSRTTVVAPKCTKLYADVLFENATVGLPLANIQTFPGEGIKPVQMMKLFQRKAGSLPPLKGYVIEALVQHVLECGQPSEPNGAPNPLPTKSVSQAFYMTLTLFLVEPSARDLDNRVCHNLAVPSGFLFDRGDFDCWRGRVKPFMRDLIMLATCLSKDTAKRLDADELFRRVLEPCTPIPEPFQRSAPWKAPSAAAATSAAASPGGGGSCSSSQPGGEAHTDEAMPFSELVAKLKPDVEKACVSICPKDEVNPMYDLGPWEPDVFLWGLETGPQSTHGSVAKPGPNVAVSEGPEAPAPAPAPPSPPSPPFNSQLSSLSPADLDSQSSFAVRGFAVDPAGAAIAGPSGAQGSPPRSTRRSFTSEELLAAINIISPPPQIAQQRQNYDGTFVTVSNVSAGPCVDVDVVRSPNSSISSGSGGASSFAASASLSCSGAIDHPLASLFEHPLAEEARRLCYMYRYPNNPQVGLLPPVPGAMAQPQPQPQPNGCSGQLHPRLAPSKDPPGLYQAVERAALATSSPRPALRPASWKETDIAGSTAEPAMHALGAPASSHDPETGFIFSLSSSIRESLSRSKPGCGGSSGNSSNSSSSSGGSVNTNNCDEICGAAGSGSLAPWPRSTDRSAIGRSGLAAEIHAPSSATGEIPGATSDCDPRDPAPAAPYCSGSPIRAGIGRTLGNSGKNGDGGRGGKYGGSDSSDEGSNGGGRGAVPPELETPAATVQVEWAQVAAPGLPDQSARRWTDSPSIPVSTLRSAAATPTPTAAAAAAATAAAAIDTVAALTVTHLHPMHIPLCAHAEVAAAEAEAATAPELDALMQPSTCVHNATAELLRSKVIPRLLERLQALLRDAQERRIQRPLTAVAADDESGDNTPTTANAAAATTAANAANAAAVAAASDAIVRERGSA